MDSMLVETFATVREAARRVLNMRHFDCQLVRYLFPKTDLDDRIGRRNDFARRQDRWNGDRERKNNCGGTSSLPSCLCWRDSACNYRQRIPRRERCSMVDLTWIFYAVKRYIRMGRIFEFLGVSVTAAKSEMTVSQLKEAYNHDVVYVTAQKLCFDYLNDWSANSQTQMVFVNRINHQIPRF